MHAEGTRTTIARIRPFAEQLVDAAQKAAGIDTSTIKKYFVLSTPRTGSSVFCAVLERNGLGWPVEWFSDLYMAQVAEILGTPELNFWDYLRTVVLGSYRPESNVFGVNFHVNQYRWLKERGGDILAIGFDRGYYLHRRNKVKQAYSFAKSTKTGFWSREAEILAGYR
jgi:LPS sulfotransferase NodH